MSRMRLHKNTRFGDNEVYPIYDIDFTNLSSTGYTQERSNDAVGSQAYKYRQWKTINNNIGLYIPRNIPKQETQEGNIIPFWHRYNNVVDGRYTLPQENLESFAAVEQGVKPEDWGTNPNYCEFIRESISSPVGLDLLRPYLNRTISTWSGSISYYEDTKRSELRMFFTDTGCSFAVTKTSYSRGDGYYIWPRTYSIGLYPHNMSSLRFPANYAYTDPDGRVIDSSYYINDTISVISPTTGYADRSMYTDGYNCQMVFVHYVQDGTDFYGVAIIQMNNLTEQSEPVAIHVSAWDASFWGTSIIAGGGGSGPWTNDGPTSYVQGGQGNFEAPSNNHGDSSGTSTGVIADNWSSKHTAFTEGYNKYLIVPRATEGAYVAPAFKEMVQRLTDPTILQGFANLLYNPIQAVITCSMIPRSFAPAITGADYIHAAGIDLTQENGASVYEATYKRVHIGSVNVSEYTDSFADFDNTAVYINLPYVGVKQLDTAAVMDGELAVDYLIDYFTCDVTAMIWTKDKLGNYNIRYEFKGNCGKPMPLTQINTMSSKLLQSAMPFAIGGGIGLTAGTLKGIGTGVRVAGYSISAARGMKKLGMTTTGGAIRSGLTMAGATIPGAVASSFGSTMSGFIGEGATIGTATSAAQALTSGQDILSSDANGGSVSSPVNTQCFLIITRPQWSAPEDYGKRFGYPSDIGGTINQSDTEAGDPFTNFLSVRAILLDGMSCLPAERAEIESLMKAGVYVSND